MACASALSMRAQSITYSWPGPLGQISPYPRHDDGHFMGTHPHWTGIGGCTMEHQEGEEFHVEMPGTAADTTGLHMDILAFAPLAVDSLIIMHHAFASNDLRLRVLVSTGPLMPEHVLLDTSLSCMNGRTVVTGLGVMRPAPGAEYAYFRLRLQPYGPAGQEWVLSAIRLTATMITEDVDADGMSIDERLSQFPTRSVSHSLERKR